MLFESKVSMVMNMYMSQLDFPMQVTKITEWSLESVEIADDIQEWINCSLYYLHKERQVRALLTYHSTHPSHAICTLSGRYDSGQVASVYHLERSNVVDRLFVGNSLIANPIKESWMYDSVPLMDITTAIYHSDIDNRKFSASPYQGQTIEVVIPDSVAQKVYEFINQ